MPSPLNHVELHLVESIDDLWRMKAWAGERRDTPLCFDSETGGLDPFRHKLRLIQIGDKQQGWSVPFDLWGGGVLELLRDYQGPLGAHNASFDWRFLKLRAGLELPWHKIHDTMVLAALDDPVRTKALKPLSCLLIDKHAAAGEQVLRDGMRKQGWDWATVPLGFAPYWGYAAADPVLTAHLWEKLYEPVMARSPDAYSLEMGVSRVVSRMMLRGMRIDRDYIHAAIGKFKDYSIKTLNWLDEQYNVKNIMSARQLGAAFEQAGWTITKTTPTGLPRIDKEFMNSLANDVDAPSAAQQLAQVIVRTRHADKMVGTYLENFLTIADHDDVIHPQIWAFQARTGRMSVSEPALQTLPRDDKIVRGAFIPRDGHVIISCDASQIEMRLAAALSEDEGLTHLFKEMDEGGLDIYSGIATELFGTKIEKDDPRRQATKSLSYTRLYGGGVGKMAQVVNLPHAQVKVIHDAFNTRFPGLERLSRDIQRQARDHVAKGGRPATMTSMGRYLPCDPGKEFALINYRIQSEASEILKRGLLDLEAAGYGNGLLLPIHDEILIEVPREGAEEALTEIKQVLLRSSNYTVPIPWDGKIMETRWQK